MKTHIIGMGALGLLYASQIYHAQGRDSVAFILDDVRYDKYKDTQTIINGKDIPFIRLRPCDASPADLVIVTVKGPGLQAALDSLQTSVGHDTVIISLLNGIVSEQILSDRFGADKVIHCIAQGTDAACFGSSLTYTQKGQLRIGITDKALAPKLDKLARFLDDCSIDHVVEQDILHRLWGKFMLNVGLNQTCFVYDTNYGGVLQQSSLPRAIMVSAMREVLPIAAAEGVTLTENDIADYLLMLSTLDPGSMPSMAQDRINRKKSEVDLFSGTVIRLGQAHGIPTPVNDWLYERVTEIEKSYQ